MYTDRNRIEDAIIPALLESIALAHIKADPKCTDAYEAMLEIVREAVGECFNGLDTKRRLQLYRRLDRLANKIIMYFKKESFDTRKMFLTISAWIAALIEAGGVVFPEGSKMWGLLEDMGDIIQRGYKEIEDFDRIDRSALKHTNKIHSIAVNEGYF